MRGVVFFQVLTANDATLASNSFLVSGQRTLIALGVGVMGQVYHVGSRSLWNSNKAIVRKVAATMMMIVLRRKTMFIAYFCRTGSLRRLVMPQGKRIA